VLTVFDPVGESGDEPSGDGMTLARPGIRSRYCQPQSDGGDQYPNTIPFKKGIGSDAMIFPFIDDFLVLLILYSL
jgi:hypothetical protein